MAVVDVEQHWMIAWGEHTWSEDDLTGAHAALITMISSADDWKLLDPFAGPVTLMQLIAVFVSIAEQRDVLEVMAELGRAPAKVLFAALTLV